MSHIITVNLVTHNLRFSKNRMTIAALIRNLSHQSNLERKWRKQTGKRVHEVSRLEGYLFFCLFCRLCFFCFNFSYWINLHLSRVVNISLLLGTKLHIISIRGVRLYQYNTKLRKYFRISSSRWCKSQVIFLKNFVQYIVLFTVYNNNYLHERVHGRLKLRTDI